MKESAAFDAGTVRDVPSDHGASGAVQGDSTIWIATVDWKATWRRLWSGLMEIDNGDWTTLQGDALAMTPIFDSQLLPTIAVSVARTTLLNVKPRRERSVASDPPRARMSLHDQVEVWVNEGGAGGEARR